MTTCLIPYLTVNLYPVKFYEKDSVAYLSGLSKQQLHYNSWCLGVFVAKQQVSCEFNSLSSYK
jgi:hypothetical protein